jgi:hypothetical protein
MSEIKKPAPQAVTSHGARGRKQKSFIERYGMSPKEWVEFKKISSKKEVHEVRLLAYARLTKTKTR